MQTAEKEVQVPKGHRHPKGTGTQRAQAPKGHRIRICGHTYWRFRRFFNMIEDTKK